MLKNLLYTYFSNTFLTLYVLTPQNSQAHSNNLTTAADKLFECVWPFCDVGA